MRSIACFAIAAALASASPAAAQSATVMDRDRYRSVAELDAQLDELTPLMLASSGTTGAERVIELLEAVARVGTPRQACERAHRVGNRILEGANDRNLSRAGPLARLEAGAAALTNANYARKLCRDAGDASDSTETSALSERAAALFREELAGLRSLTPEMIEAENRRYPNDTPLPLTFGRDVRGRAATVLARSATLSVFPDDFERLGGLRYSASSVPGGEASQMLTAERSPAARAYDLTLADELSAAAAELANIDGDATVLRTVLPRAAFHAAMRGDGARAAGHLAALAALPSLGPDYALPEADQRCRLAVYVAAAQAGGLPVEAPPGCRSDPSAFVEALVTVTLARRIAAGDLQSNLTPSMFLPTLYSPDFGPDMPPARLREIVATIAALDRPADAPHQFRTLQSAAAAGDASSRAVQMSALEAWSARRGQAAAFARYRQASERAQVAIGYTSEDDIPPVPMMVPDFVREREAAQAAQRPDRQVGGESGEVVRPAEFAERQRLLREEEQRLRAAVPEAADILSEDAVSLDALRRELRADEALLIIQTTGYGTRAMAVSADREARASSYWDTAVLSGILQRLRWELGAEPVDEAIGTRWLAETHSGAGFSRTQSHRLYQQIFSGLDPVLAGKKRLIVIADGPLAAFPFSTLVAQAPEGEDHDPAALRRTAWLGERFAISQLPSVQSFVLLRRRAALEAGAAPVQARTAFLGVGNPATLGEELECRLDPGAVRGAASRLRNVMDVDYRNPADLIRALPRIPCTETELRSVQAALGSGEQSRIVTGEAATERAFRGMEVGNLDLLILATHGLLAKPSAGLMESALVLTPPDADSPPPDDDGFLLESEIPSLGIRANWVILSACNSGSGGSNALLGGLARAFMLGGARTLLVSYWPVRDDAAAQIVASAVRLSRENSGISRAEALQAAMRGVRNDSSQDDAGRSLAHPSAWASFSMIGD